MNREEMIEAYLERLELTGIDRRPTRQNLQALQQAHNILVETLFYDFSMYIGGKTILVFLFFVPFPVLCPFFLLSVSFLFIHFFLFIHSFPFICFLPLFFIF